MITLARLLELRSDDELVARLLEVLRHASEAGFSTAEVIADIRTKGVIDARAQVDLAETAKLVALACYEEGRLDGLRERDP